jgi:hypothetical protein
MEVTVSSWMAGTSPARTPGNLASLRRARPASGLGAGPLGSVSQSAKPLIVLYNATPDTRFVAFASVEGQGIDPRPEQRRET